MQQWLETFACRTGLPPLLFLAVGVCVLGLTFLTVGFQAFRTARIDPARSLRHE